MPPVDAICSNVCGADVSATDFDEVLSQARLLEAAFGQNAVMARFLAARQSIRFHAVEQYVSAMASLNEDWFSKGELAEILLPEFQHRLKQAEISAIIDTIEAFQTITDVSFRIASTEDLRLYASFMNSALYRRFGEIRSEFDADVVSSVRREQGQSISYDRCRRFRIWRKRKAN